LKLAISRFTFDVSRSKFDIERQNSIIGDENITIEVRSQCQSVPINPRKDDVSEFTVFELG